MQVDYTKTITIEPGKRGGKPCIRGLRITVYDVLEYLASGMTEEEILADFPDLTQERYSGVPGLRYGAGAQVGVGFCGEQVLRVTTPVYEDGLRLSVTRVKARNFKSIRELDLELRPLTVLVGPNASGKSNVLDVLRFIRHALQMGLDSAITSRQGMGAIRRSTPKGGTRDVEVGVTAKRGRFQIRYGFVLGSRAGNYRVKREYGVVTPADPEEERVEFEVREGRLVRPRGLDEEPLRNI